LQAIIFAVNTCIHVCLLRPSACKCIWCKRVSFPPFF